MAVSGNGQPKARFHSYVPQSQQEANQPPSNATRSPFGPGDDTVHSGHRQADPDVWDFDPDIKLPNDAYRGVRRASAARPYRTVGLVVGLVVLATVALVIAMKHGADTTNRAAGRDSPTVVPSDHGAGQPSSPQVSTGTTTGVPVTSSPVGISAFAPLTFEAEAGPPSVKRRGADVETLAGASGGKVVRFVGGSGELEIRGVAFPDAGTYRIAIYYASAAAGTAVLSVPDASPLTVSFAGGSGCCAAAAVNMALSSGQRTITVSGVTSGVAIDRVVITRSRP